MENLERHLANITLAPYIVKAMALIGVKRRSGSNMFRHQISTMGILLEQGQGSKYTAPAVQLDDEVLLCRTHS